MSDSKTGIEVIAYLIIFLIVISTWIWLPRLTGAKVPVAIVEGRSMYPLLRTGDIVFLVNKSPGQINVGDVVVYKSKQNPDRFIIHRVIGICEYHGTYYYRVWGDNNYVEDTNQYDFTPSGCRGISYQRIVGVVANVNGYTFKIPYLGILSVIGG